MVKISFIASGIILGLATISSASASLISRSFLDQALTDYATTTALDLKADKADVTDLSDKIGGAWPYVREMSPGLNSLSLGLYPIEINLENASDLVRFLFGGRIESGIDQGGVLSILGQSVLVSGAYDINTGQIDEGFRSLMQLTDGWTDSEKKTYLGVKGLNDKIGTLPSGNFPEFPESEKSFSILKQPLTYPTSLAELITAIYGNSETGKIGLLDGIIASFPLDTDGDGGPDAFTGLIPNFRLAKEANDLANANATKIGTLPTEIVIGNSNGSIDMFNITKRQSVSLPKDYTFSDFIQDMYYGSFGVSAGLDSSPFYGLSDIIDHVMYGGITGEASPLTDKQYKGLIDLTLEINKIGDLPTEYATVGAALTAMDAKIGTVPDGKNLAGMISETDAKIGAISPNTTVSDMISKTNAKFGVLPPDTTVAGMIGTLPGEYSTVGAALTAMKSDIDAKNLPSTSDDGQYVLSAKKVGDTITYTWVKMDLTNEEQAQ